MLHNERENKVRFNPANRLRAEMNAKPIQFHPEEKGRDRFGNRLFSSIDLAYEDNVRTPVRASLLVSPQGEGLIKSNRGLLRDIESGLVQMESLDFRKMGLMDLNERGKLKGTVIDLGNDKKIEYLGSGRFSIVYKLTLEERVFALKVPFETKIHGQDDAQPYVNEMLQIAALKKDLEQELTALNVKVEFPTILFASGQMSCSDFVEGRKPNESVFRDRSLSYEESSARRNDLSWQLHDMVYRYIREQEKNGNPLWKDVIPDVIRMADLAPHLSNFIQRSDGTLVWIDPLWCN